MFGFGLVAMLWMFLGTLLFIVLVVLAIWFLIRWLGQKAPTPPLGQAPSSQPKQGEYEQPQTEHQHEEKSPW